VTWLYQVIVAAYVLAVALLPLSHHDVVCHAKSTTHCTSCVVGSSAEPAAAPVSPRRFNAESPGSWGEQAACALPAVFSTGDGRAPPSLI
jgi:hypothetical protein